MKLKINRNFYVVSAIILVVALAAFAMVGMFGNFGNDAKNGDKVKACPECVCSEKKCIEKNLTCPECICPQQKCPDVKCPEFECPKPACNVTITTEIKNYGNASFNGGKVEFTAGSKIQTSGVNSTFTWNTSQNDKASLLFELNYSCPACPKCDSGSCACSCSACPSCSKPEKPDLTIANITIIGNLTAGENIEIVALVKNLGNVPIDYTKVEIKIDNFTEYRFVHLDANSEKKVTFNWTVIEGEHTLIAVIDTENVTIESDETNNNLTTKKLSICFVPYDDMYINENTTLCKGVYNINKTVDNGVIIINSSNIVLDCNGATLNGSGGVLGYGIYLEDKHKVTIKNCTIVGYRIGIDLTSSSNNTIVNNTLNLHSHGLILRSFSNNNNLTGNTLNSNEVNGIYLEHSSKNNISNNDINLNGNGIILQLESNFNKISNNYLTNNNIGIAASLMCVKLSDPARLWCYGQNTNNTLQKNEISNNNIGIYSQNSSSVINSNVVCNNLNLDFNSSDWQSSYGDGNTCDKPNGWDDLDNGTIGCKYLC